MGVTLPAVDEQPLGDDQPVGDDLLMTTCISPVNMKASSLRYAPNGAY
jgi:hypothetical protein